MISSTYRLPSSHTSLFLHFFPPVRSVCWFTLSFPDYFHGSFLVNRLRHAVTIIPLSFPYKSASHPLTETSCPPSHHNISCTRLTLCYDAPVSHRVLLSRSSFKLVSCCAVASISICVLIGYSSSPCPVGKLR